MPNSKSAGFTLIEVMIVLAILAAIVSVAGPRLLRRDQNVKSVVRNFLVLGKEVRNRARMSNSTMRIVLDLDPQTPRYWVERASGPLLLDPEDDSSRKALEEDSNESQKTWSTDTSLMRKPKGLPPGLSFSMVETKRMRAPQTDGEAHIYFFPEGLMEEAALQIKDSSGTIWTLIFNPLTGQADILDQAKTLKEISR